MLCSFVTLNLNPLNSLTLGIRGIFLYNNNATWETSRLWLRVKVAENRYLGISPDMSCERVDAFFKIQNSQLVW